jgi:hypothetical protein
MTISVNTELFMWLLWVYYFLCALAAIGIGAAGVERSTHYDLSTVILGIFVMIGLLIVVVI